MAKLEYNEQLVDDSLNLLKQAETQISNTGTNVVSALKTIANARGANYLDINAMLGAGGLNESCIELIEQTVTGIQERVEMVKQYNEDYENSGFFEKVFSSVGLIGAKFVEGIFGAGEQILDGFASAAGLVVGIVSKDAKEAIGEFVKKDHVGDWFKDKYDNEWSDMVKYSYFKEDGLVATAAKIFGTSAGYTAALALGGGIYGAATHATAGATALTSTSILNASATGAKVLMGSVKAAATLAGIGGLGSGTQAAMLSGKTFDEAIWTGVKTGIIQAGTVLVVDWGIKKISKAWAQFKGDGVDDLAGAGGTPDAPDGPVADGPDGPVPDGPDGPIPDGPDGPIPDGPDGPIPDGPDGPIPDGPDGPTGATNNGSGTGSASDPFGGSGSSSGTSGSGSSSGTSGTNGAGGATGATGASGASSTQAADDLLHAAGKSDADMLDDLYRAVERGDITPDAAKAAIENKFKEGFTSAANRREFAKMWHPDKHGAALDELARVGRNPVAGGSAPAADAAEAAADLGKAAGTSQTGSPISGSSPVDETLDAASDLGQAAGTTSAGTPRPGEAIQLGGSTMDETLDAASDLGQAAGTTSAGAPRPGEAIQLGSGTPVDEAVDAVTDLGHAAGSASSSSSSASQVSDELAAAYKDYDDLLIKRENLNNQLTDLGGKAGNAPTEEFMAIRNQIDEVDNLIANAGQRIEDLSTAGTPAVRVGDVPDAPLALPPGQTPDAPLALPPGQTPDAPLALPPRDIPDGPLALPPKDIPDAPLALPPGDTPLALPPGDTPLALPPGQTPIALPPGTTPQTPIALPPGTTPQTPIALPPGQTPQTPIALPPGKTPQTPIALPPGGDPVIPPPVVTTPWRPVPIIPINPQPDIPIEPVVIPPAPVDIPVVDPPVIPPVDPPVDPPVIPPVVPPVDPPVIPPDDPIPTPPEEYAPIPNTGIAGTGKTILDYLAPGIAGAALGLTGVLGTKALKNKNDDEDEDDF